MMHDIAFVVWGLGVLYFWRRERRATKRAEAAEQTVRRLLAGASQHDLEAESDLALEHLRRER
jgi:hypothetical protein